VCDIVPHSCSRSGGVEIKPEVAQAIKRSTDLRRQVLQRLPRHERLRLLEALLVDFFVEQRSILLKWAGLTGQSAQIDTGYIAQHVASIVLAEPGQGFKGKGVDLADGSEVKSAAILSGVDRPRWNHDLGTPAGDLERINKGDLPKWQVYLKAPVVWYLLFDRVVSASTEPELRVRAWCVDAQRDEAWRDLIHRFVAQRRPKQYNLQLHPPVGYDDSVVVNTLGNLNFANVKVLEARVANFLASTQDVEVRWVQAPPESVRPIEGRTIPLPYGGRSARPSRLSTVDDVAIDVAQLKSLVPSLDIDDLLVAITTETQAELADFEDRQ